MESRCKQLSEKLGFYFQTKKALIEINVENRTDLTYLKPLQSVALKSSLELGRFYDHSPHRLWKIANFSTFAKDLRVANYHHHSIQRNNSRAGAEFGEKSKKD